MTGLFAFETNPTTAAMSVFEKIYDTVADKIIGKLTDKVIGDTLGVPEEPTASSSPGYKTWYDDNWGEDKPFALRLEATKKLWEITGSILEEAKKQGLIALDLKDYVKIDGAGFDTIGLDAAKGAIKAALVSWLKSQLPSGVSNYALLMGGGSALRGVLSGMIPAGEGRQLVQEVVAKFAGGGINLDKVTHNRLMVPSTAMNQPLLAFSIFAPYLSSPDAKLKITFKPTDMDPGLAAVPLAPIRLSPSIFQRLNYSVEVPDTFKGKAAMLEFEFVGIEVPDDIEFVGPGAVLGIARPATLDFLASQLVFLDDVRFSAGLEARIAAPIVEGGQARLDVTFAPADAAQPVQLFVAWKDGSAPESFTVPAGTTSHTFYHSYADDNPSGTAQDTLLVQVNATNVIGASTAQASLEISNVAPVVSGLALQDLRLDENSVAVLTGNFSDPALGNDGYTIKVDWGDGHETSATVLTLPSAGAPGTFRATHLYLDDKPSQGTALDTLPIRITATDDDGGIGTGATTIEIANKPPRIETLALDASTIAEGESAVLRGTISDDGWSDVHTVTVQWAGRALTVPVTSTGPGSGSFVVTIPIEDDDPSGSDGDDLRFDVRVEDDDTGQASDFLDLHVANVAPTMGVAVEAASIVEGDTARLLLTIADAGVNDSFELTVAWDDGVTQVFALPAGSSSYTVEREFLDDDPSETTSDVRSAVLTLKDDDGGVASDSASLTVSNAAPLPACSPISRSTPTSRSRCGRRGSTRACSTNSPSCGRSPMPPEPWWPGRTNSSRRCRLPCPGCTRRCSRSRTMTTARAATA
ncbi:hypothetical protein [Ramlibacter montanisoli]|uniref:Uncharacterized protein n=1 Tax=Ramlibacter montanisoli TaxID=2732512 RepID=A0A849K5U4_9BURK|nr:hypothetical protein [Ramlibacter montanisoli]NNU43758.1 hypothetical protein [Ramlibacter montanisoli]